MKKIRYKTLFAATVCACLSSAISAQETTGDNNDGKQADKISVAYLSVDSQELIESVGVADSDKLGRSFGSATNIGDALYGLIPGLMVTAQGGELGNNAPRLLIRGCSTYSVSTPLILIDGFESDLDALSISEIESISVLKDAAATAIYGLRGANGVILVTTKRGENGPTRFDVKVSYGATWFQQTPDLLDSYQYASFYNKALSMDGFAEKYDTYKYEGGSQPGDPNIYHNNNFVKDLTRAWSPMYHAGIQMSGREKGIGYYVNVNYQNNFGMLADTDKNDGYSTQSSMDKISVRTNVDIDVIKNLEMDVDLNFGYKTCYSPGATLSTVWDSMVETPTLLFNTVNPDGSIGGTTDYRDNPYGLITSTGYLKNLTRDVNATFRARYDFGEMVKGLSAGAAVSIYDSAYTTDNKTKEFAVYSITEDLSLEKPYLYAKYGDDTVLSWGTSSTFNRRTSINADVTYNTNFDKHNLSAMLIYRMDGYRLQGIYERRSHMGFSGRLQYDYDKKYLAEATFGYEGSEVFAPGKRFGFFPAAAIGWVASREDFIKENAGWIDFLKVRASFGVSGSDMFVTGDDLSSRIFYNQYYGTLTGYNFGDTSSAAATGYGQLRLANENLTWEKSYKLDAGFDMVMLGGVGVGFNYFVDRRTDIFTLYGNIPALIGVTDKYKPYSNNGCVLNRGFESYLRYDRSFGDWTIGAGVMFDYNHNEILSKGDEPLYQYANMKRIGHSLNQLFGLVSTGLWDGTSSHTDQAWEALREGDALYADLTGDDLVNELDVQAIGYPTIPEYNFSFDLSIKYRNLDFNLLMQGVDHVSAMLDGQFIPFTDNMNAYANAFDAWTPDNTTAVLPRLTTVTNSNNSQASTLWLVSTKFIKLRNVELGYTLHGIKGIESCRIFLRGVNLLTFNNSFSLADPETMTGYPNLASVHAGLNLLF